MLNHISPPNQDKKVCIIIPVYNAEKYLGYCLNSVLSQTYTNWNAILVDDGSTDASLEICRNYEAIDSRFRVFSKPNGGVSSARNFGLRYAQGDYLEFVDSDDCLAQDLLEKQVSLAIENNSQLVVVNMMIVDFNKPKGKHVTLNSSWLNQSPCVLGAEEFREKRMRLIWFTALLEGPCAKLYDLSLWKQRNISFPEDLSLGEDFVANMTYYSACNNAVFLNECGYYYNQYTDSGSLCEKYRPDLFEIKMYLMEKLEEHFGGRNKLSEPELDAFYCYAASCGLVCVEKAVLTSGLGKAELLENVQKMFAHPLFAESIRCATYIPERFAACIAPAKENDLEAVIQYIASDTFRKTQKQAETENAAGAVSNSGLLNRIIRKLMRTVRPILGQGKWGERLARWEQEIAQFGLKFTIKSHVQARRTRKEKLAAFIDARIWCIYNRLEERCDVLDRRIVALDTQLAEHEATLHTEFGTLAKTLCDKVDAQTASVDDKINASATQIQKNVNDYTWITEQRMTRYAYLRDINELRQRRKAIMLATAEHANIGDAAITLAEQQVLSEQFPEYFQVEISTFEINQKEAYLHAILNPEDILFINGGGNLGDQYPEEEELHRKIVSEFPNNKIIIFPQTIYFSDTENGTLELQKSSKVYNSHKDLTMFVRGEASLELAKAHFAQVKTVLMPDMVHVLRSNYVFERSGALLCLRDDKEGKLDCEGKDLIVNTAKALTGSIDRSSNIHTEDVTREIRGLVVRKELMRFAKHQVVITDRLHGMIFSAVTGTPCVVLSSYNHKIREYYEAFFQDSNAVFFIGDDMGKLESAVKEAMQVTDAHYPVFEGDSMRSIRAISMKQ